MAYATVGDVEKGFRSLSETERQNCADMLDECAILIDTYNSDATNDVKRLVSCRIIRRAIGYADDTTLPLGASQGTISAMGYSQTFTLAGSSGELYLGKVEKKLLGCGNKIGSYSPVEELIE